MTWLTQLLNHFRPIVPEIQPAHWQSWDTEPRRRKK
nr:MAG TPA: hypothetical protein [Caudoviricetes sp.]